MGKTQQRYYIARRHRTLLLTPSPRSLKTVPPNPAQNSTLLLLTMTNFSDETRLTLSALRWQVAWSSTAGSSGILMSSCEYKCWAPRCFTLSCDFQECYANVTGTLRALLPRSHEYSLRPRPPGPYRTQAKCNSHPHTTSEIHFNIILLDLPSGLFTSAFRLKFCKNVSCPLRALHASCTKKKKIWMNR